MDELKEIEASRSGLINWREIDDSIGLTLPQGYLFADEITARLIHALKVRHFDIISKHS